MKTFDKYEDAQTILEQIYNGRPFSDAICGMSIRIQGGDFIELQKHSNRADLFPYFNKADEMIREGRIFYVYPMKCKWEGCPTRFQYGGGWACNSCSTCINTPNWWKIKVMKDGDEFCCVGNGFINLQESVAVALRTEKGMMCFLYIRHERKIDSMSAFQVHKTFHRSQCSEHKLFP